MAAAQDTGLIAFEHNGIGTILSRYRLAVPLNQREFSWEPQHVTDLLSDFSNAIDNYGSAHFLGTIVLTKGEGSVPEVSDGQQRLATTTIVLAAIRDYLFRAGDTVRATTIEQTYLRTTDLETTQVVPKLRLNVDDNEFFVKFVLSSPDSPDRKVRPVKDSHHRIKTASELTARHLESVLSPHKEAARTSRLLEWERFIRTGAQVIALRVPDHLNAFVMFETLNDRGLKASQADLLKNHLLSLAGDRIREAQQKWAHMLGVLEALEQDDLTVTYLHHLLITKFGPTKEREVYDKVKQTVNSQGRTIEFLDELSDSSHDYAALLNPNHKKWNAYGTSTKRHIGTINDDLRVEQIRPMMFAIAKRFSVKEATKAFRMCVFWSVRFLVVGGRGGLLDTNYAKQAYEIETGKIKTAAQLASSVAGFLPSDALFEASFAEARVSKAYIARYYLRALERTVKEQDEPELIPNDDVESINLEHILPDNPQASWPDIDAETAAAYHRHLGNMVLLQATKNAVIGNSPFSEKRAVLRGSTFLLTQDAAKYDTWGVREISERQRKMAKLALKTWPLALP